MTHRMQLKVYSFSNGKAACVATSEASKAVPLSPRRNGFQLENLLFSYYWLIIGCGS